MAFASPAAAQTQPVVIELPYLSGGNWINVQAISAAGHVVGQGSNGQGQQRAFVWTRTEGIRELDALGQYSAALGVNTDGFVVGQSYNGSNWLGVAWKPDSTAVVQITPGEGVAWAVNADGTVVGRTYNSQLGRHQAFAWKSGTLTVLPAPDYSEARFITDTGIIYGQASINGQTHVVAWKPEAGGYTLVDLSPAASWAYFQGISANGQYAVGQFQTNGNQRAFVTNGLDNITDLNVSGSWAYARGANAMGQVVGNTESNGTKGFVYTPGTGTALLPQPANSQYTQASGITDSGLVIGSSYNGSNWQAWMWEGTTNGPIVPSSMGYGYSQLE